MLSENSIPYTSVSDITGFPEILDGRVKTLHPAIHGGLLAKRTPQHEQQLLENNIKFIDLVVVNLYPFEDTIADQSNSFDDAIEKIDIGGPTMIRAAAKNHHYVTVLSDPSQYEIFRNEYERSSGEISYEFRKECAARVFSLMAKYNAAIAEYLNKEKTIIPDIFTFTGKKIQELRYGENPHQQAALFSHENGMPLAGIKQLHGKELSFNNILDLQAALIINSEFEEPSCTIIKHNNPCGVAIGKNLTEAHKKARSTDQVSAFGGIIALNRKMDLEHAEEIYPFFTECIVAPEISEEALQKFSKKKNIRLLLYKPDLLKAPAFDIKVITGGFLLQTSDSKKVKLNEAEVVTKRKPTDQEMKALQFAWKIVKHVKSNAIVFTNSEQTLGIGAGQMSRVDSTEIAISKAAAAKLSLENSVVASDAFFPFKDSIEALAKAGAKAIIQPGGSVRDDEVIQAADEAGLTMIFTGTRHFKH